MRETEILVEQQPPQGVFVCDHAGLVINKFSLSEQKISVHVKEATSTVQLHSLDIKIQDVCAVLADASVIRGEGSELTNLYHTPGLGSGLRARCPRRRLGNFFFFITLKPRFE